MLISNQCIRYRPSFYRATRMHSADYAMARCLPTHLSVCLSVGRTLYLGNDAR